MIYCKYIYSFHGADFSRRTTQKTAGDHPESWIEHIRNIFHRIHGAAIYGKYMVCHGSHQYTPLMLALIYQHQPDPSWVCEHIMVESSKTGTLDEHRDALDHHGGRWQTDRSYGLWTEWWLSPYLDWHVSSGYSIFGLMWELMGWNSNNSVFFVGCFGLWRHVKSSTTVTSGVIEMWTNCRVTDRLTSEDIWTYG